MTRAFGKSLHLLKVRFSRSIRHQRYASSSLQSSPDTLCGIETTLIDIKDLTS